jgi:cardiolipin synthase A/B
MKKLPKTIRIALYAIAFTALVFGIELVLLAYHDVQDVLAGPNIETTSPVLPPAPADARFIELASLVTFTPLGPGNTVELLRGAATYPRLWADLRAAQRSITMQMYYCGPGQLADTLANILIERARAGVSVHFLGDGFGCYTLGDPYFQRLRAAGVRTQLLRPVKWYTLHRSKHRSHVRAIVIDGSIGYTGGFGIDDKWITTPKAKGWLDSNVRFSGPAVNSLQAAFAGGWAEATGELLTGEALYPLSNALVLAPDTSKHAVAGVLFSVAAVGATTAERMVALTVGAARTKLYITNPYFLPGDGLQDQLIKAARRGVDVRIITAGDQNDVAIVRNASRASYQNLLDAGVRIYEYQPVFNHAKTIVVDDVWASAGTLNLDPRSLRLNEETTLLVHDSATVAQFTTAFETDMRASKEVKKEEFRKRSWFNRLVDRASNVLAPLL